MARLLLQEIPVLTWEIFFDQEWGEIASNHLLDGLPNPRKPLDSKTHTKLNRRLTRQLKPMT